MENEKVTAFDGDKKEWQICVNITKGYKMVFEKPVSFETAIGLLEVSGFGELDDVPEIEQEQVLDYNVGVLIEGNIGEIPDHSRIN